MMMMMMISGRSKIWIVLIKDQDDEKLLGDISFEF